MSEIINSKITRLFSDNPFFYKLYFHLVRKHKGMKPNYFTSDTELYFDAYPRSGNTYFLHLVRNIFPETKTVHHLHKIAPLKIAMRKKLILIILFRDPSECISSNYLKHFSMRDQELPEIIDMRLLKRMVEDYYYYYKFVLKRNKNFHIINFSSFIKNPSNVIYEVSKIIGSTLYIEEIERKVDIYSKTYSSATTKYGSSKPSKIKEEKKAIIKTSLEKISKFKECKQIYMRLLEIS